MSSKTPAPTTTKTTRVKAEAKGVKTLAEFRAVHDKSFVVPNAIRAGLEKLGKDGWEYENEFVRMCGVSVTDFARFREEFADHYIFIGGERSGKRVWAGTKATADKMRSMV